ncbi:hypothetical protein AA0114_g10345 [Alternaria tenuissima]|uniref:NADAR domain-containing protein n=1 Tax=Alternaria tenuissima TaxID=119927 RepID=A0A4Q4M4L5_9PLEO|nr:hypothetical protein AA0114_g10345 [Alternaria tenuissima]
MEPECEADEGPVFFSFESNQSNGFLSPAFLGSFQHENTEYNCSEQFFQAKKALWFEDDSGLYEAIVSATDPQEQSAIGKHIEANNPFWSRSWATTLAYRVIMLAACLKFTVSEHAQMLAQKLIATGHRELVMADPDDAFLGIGLDRVAATAHIEPWPGRNLLGEVLMDLRLSLRVEASLREERKVFSMARFRVTCPAASSSQTEVAEETE